MAEVRQSSGLGGVAIPLEVSNLVDYVWEEATGQLEEILAVTMDTLKTEQVDKAEASLLSIRRLLDQGGPPEGMPTSLWWIHDVILLPHVAMQWSVCHVMFVCGSHDGYAHAMQHPDGCHVTS